MEALLQEMRDMETLVPRQAPPVASLLAGPEDTWAAELLETQEQNVIDWSRDFLAEQAVSLGGPDPLVTRSSGGHQEVTRKTTSHLEVR